MKLPQPHFATLGYVVVNLLFGIVAVYGCFLVFNDLIGVVRGGDALIDSFTIHAQISPGAVVLPEGIHLDASVVATLRAEEPTSPQMAISLARDVSNALFYLALLWLVRGIAEPIRSSQPFGGSGVRRLRAIGVLLLVGSPLLEAMTVGLESILFHQLTALDTLGLVTAPYSFPEGASLAGLVALILAQVFALGGQLSDDVKATI